MPVLELELRQVHQLLRQVQVVLRPVALPRVQGPEERLQERVERVAPPLVAARAPVVRLVPRARSGPGSSWISATPTRL